MCRGDSAELVRLLGRAAALPGALGQSRVGSEHLFVALVEDDGPVGAALVAGGVSARPIRQLVVDSGPAGASVAADRAALAVLGILLDQARDAAIVRASDRPAGREPRLPVGLRRSRERCRSAPPPLGLDLQAAYEASLRLALARREREHRLEHLALTLVALDPGVAWLLGRLDIDDAKLLADLRRAFPPPRRSWLLRVERRCGSALRTGSVLRRYQRTTGRVPTAAGAVSSLISP